MRSNFKFFIVVVFVLIFEMVYFVKDLFEVFEFSYPHLPSHVFLS